MNKIKKRKAKLLAILTLLSLVGCKTKTIQEEIGTITTTNYSNLTYFEKPKQIEVVDNNGVVYPNKDFEQTDYDAFARMSIPLYDSYKRDKEVIGRIAEYQSMDRTYTNGEFSYVTTEDGKTGYVHDELIIVLPHNYVEVDISDQKVKVVDNNETVLYCDVVTGKPGTDTNIGYTEVSSKTYDRPMVGPGYRLDVHYCIEFNTSEECFHDNYNRSEFGGDIYLTNGSLGCVNMKLEDVQILDKHTIVGTKVLTHR